MLVKIKNWKRNALRRVLGSYWGLLGPFVASWVHIWVSLEPPRTILWPLGLIFGGFWGHWKPSWGHLGATLGPLRALKPRNLRCVWHFARQAKISVLVSLHWSCLDAALAILATLGISWGHLEQSRGHLGAILGPSCSKLGFIVGPKTS